MSKISFFCASLTHPEGLKLNWTINENICLPEKHRTNFPFEMHEIQ